MGAICVGIFATYAFTYSGDAEAHRSEASVPVAQHQPTARDLVIFERQLRKATRDSKFAKTCVRGQVIGGTEVHVAMNFPPLDRPASAEAPAYARANVEKTRGAPKALVLESKEPTLWSVTGSPSAIILLGESVIADFPEGTPIFAPRFAEECNDDGWAHPPKKWEFHEAQNMLGSLVDDMNRRFDSRAQIVANRLFNADAASWRVQRGATVMEF
jgi:hypothetical protein